MIPARHALKILQHSHVTAPTPLFGFYSRNQLKSRQILTTLHRPLSRVPIRSMAPRDCAGFAMNQAAKSPSNFSTLAVITMGPVLRTAKYQKYCFFTRANFEIFTFSFFEFFYLTF